MHDNNLVYFLDVSNSNTMSTLSNMLTNLAHDVFSRRALTTRDAIVRKVALLGTLLILIELLLNSGGEDTQCLGPRCLTNLN